jgi:nitrous-oxide reductase
MKLVKAALVLLVAALVAAIVVMAGCGSRSTRAGQSDLLQIAQSRGLTPDDAARAVKTFVPPGGRDEYMLFAPADIPDRST